MRHAVPLLIALLTPALLVPRWWCGRQADGLYEGRAEDVIPLARSVAQWVESGVDTERFGTGSERFDGEWAFGTYQMAVLGLGQVLLEHPRLDDELGPAMDAAAARLTATETLAFGEAAWGEQPLGSLESDRGHGYLGYLALAMGMHRLVRPDSVDADLHDRVTESLSRRLDEEPQGLFETYPGESYPPDISAVIGAVGLHGRATGADHSARISRWTRALRRGYVDPDSGLLVQAADARTGAHLDRPRASGTALAAYFLAFADTPLSNELYRALRSECHIRFLGFGGIREYARGERGFGDIDSGPVILGVGLSATGFTVAGARVHRDRETYRTLARTAHAFGAPLDVDGRRTNVTGGPLGDAILLAMLTAGPGTSGWEDSP